VIAVESAASSAREGHATDRQKVVQTTAVGRMPVVREELLLKERESTAEAWRTQWHQAAQYIVEPTQTRACPEPARCACATAVKVRTSRIIIQEQSCVCSVPEAGSPQTRCRK